MQAPLPKPRRDEVVSLLKGESIEIEDAATKLGLSVREVRDCWEKNSEVEIATRFLSEFGAASKQVITLKEFLGVERDARTNIDLDDVCPDVVAQMNDGFVGIELTAYADNESHDRLSAIMYRVSNVLSRDFASNYPDLLDLILDYSPNKNNVLPLKSVENFVQQLLAFVREEHRRRPVKPGEYRRLPLPNDRAGLAVFGEFNLLQRHVTAISIGRYRREYAAPVSVAPGGFATHFGISIDHILSRIQAKAKALKKACLKRQDEAWLLIHASGWTTSSVIPALVSEEIKRLLNSALPDAAKQSGFKRAVLWDGLHGGFVDFASGEFREFDNAPPS